MCSITGFCNFTKDMSNCSNILINMNNKLKHRGHNESGIYINSNIGLGHNNSSVSNTNKQPMEFKYHEKLYTIILDGQIYNRAEIAHELIDNGFELENYSDPDILLKSYILYGHKIVNRLNGVFAFAIWNESKKELFLARDNFGIKPLYYSYKDNSFIFASEIKGLLEYPEITTTINQTGIKELFGIGPAHTPGYTIYEDIEELKPGNYAVFNSSGLFTTQYWSLKSTPHTDTFDETCNHVKYLLESSIKHQLITDKPLCTFLSGGLDSSIITKYAADDCKIKNKETLSTYSVDYKDNDKNFIKNDFQPNSDSEFIQILKNTLKTNHHHIIIDTPELYSSLKDAMISRDFPGMADIDSSLLLFCKYVKNDYQIAISGECSDEIFAGYPWFFNDKTTNTFPWSVSINERNTLLNPIIASNLHLKEYVDFRYSESLNNIDYLDTDSEETKEKRKISYLTLNWFMQTLLDRSDRMAMFNNLELRVPFCDYRIVEYMWNVPWEYKAFNNREKGLLRYIMKDVLPGCIIDRKKSPYPKTHNPTYFNIVKDELSHILNNPNEPLNDLINRKYVQQIIDSNGEIFTKPWFGQLMTTPQLLAYLIQVNDWFKIYKPNVRL